MRTPSSLAQSQRPRSEVQKYSPAARDKAVENNAELQRHVLMIYPAHHRPEHPWSQLDWGIIFLNLLLHLRPRSSLDNQTIIHQEEEIVPRRGCQLFQQNLLSNGSFICLPFEQFIQKLVQQVAKWSTICKSKDHFEEKPAKLNPLKTRQLLRHRVADSSQDPSRNRLSPERMKLELKHVLLPSLLRHRRHYRRSTSLRLSGIEASSGGPTGGLRARSLWASTSL